MIDNKKLPRHIAIIMDGNGRWASKRHIPKIFGHRAGARTVDRITEAAAKIGVEALTLYSFSTENWRRPKEEIDGLMKLLYDYLKSKYTKLQKNKIRLNAIGRLKELPAKTRERLSEVMEKTSENKGMVLTLALNYGGRAEIVDAARALAVRAEKGKIKPDAITEDLFGRFLYTKGLPDVDLLIRTSGQMRISNFLLWQISYAEIVITKLLWPDFKKEHLLEAIEEYQARDRRFGGR
ncbi:MAG: isoprenyl transferase [Candidatus Omnitrophica bacterium]|nr:isoprenyl transferase [Candidatus Omnitrophota bacterium]